jgi:trimeric autotransporter adhesin
LPISSNPVTITTPGTASDYAWFAAPGQSQYVFPVELLSGTFGSLTRLPYVPNSMVMDRLGNSIYFGSSRELMIFSTTSGTVFTQNNSFPGVVLAVAPDGSTVLINDQERQIFYLYNTITPSFTTSTFGGLGAAAAWTPDSKTLYITDSAALGANHSDMLYVYNINTGWTTHALPCSVYNATTCPSPSTGAQALAITIPSVGAYLSGSHTVAHTWCPTGTAGNYASMIFYPQSDSVAAQTDVLAATTDGEHILGAALTGGGVRFNDIGVAITPAACTLTAPLSTNPTLLTPTPLSVNANAAAVNQVVPSPVSNLAFITYFPPATGATTGASLPYYVPRTYTPGSAYTANPVQYITLTGSSAITAPLAGAFVPDDSIFFVSTAGDNMIHYISVPTLTDMQQISPNLPACTPVSAGGNDLGCTYTGSGAIVPATAIAVKPRSTT